MHTPNEEPRGTTRRLSAIMFTDMVGYTALLQQDEPRARRDRKRQRSVLERHTQRHGGRILQFFGDGALTVFDSAIEAVASAVAIQRELSEEPRVPLRIGIHTGDIVHDEDGVFGDGVNVASRIQSLGTPGSVLVSAKVYDEIKNQPDLRAVSLGEFSLKNVLRPVEVFGIACDGIALPALGSLPGRTMSARRSVAVLPFINMSADVENEYFSDGITEELINLLTRVKGLQVTARTSSFAFKGQRQDVRQIATTLGVETVVEGSVRKAGDRVRITAQLIDAASGYHLFSETYDRELTDIFALQDEIANAIVQTVHSRLVPEQFMSTLWEQRLDRLEAYLETTRTSTQAHGYYLQALHEYNKWTPEGLRRGVELLERCIAADPEYAPAHAALARACGYMASTGQMDVEAGRRTADVAARRAVELDPQLGDGHVALGMGSLFYHWDADAAYQQIQKGLGLSPGSALARQACGIHLIVIGEAERAIEEMEIAARLDPLSMLMLYSLAWAQLEAGHYGEAIDACDRILTTDPMFRAAHDGKGFALMRLGRFEEAARSFDRVVEITGDPFKGLAPRGYNFAVMGRTAEARRTLEMLHERAEEHPEQSLEFDFLTVHFGLGELDRVFPYLEAAARKRLAEVLFSVNGQFWSELRRDARYWEVIGRHGLIAIARDRPGEHGGASRS
ncbi:MAG: adenylate/guanylate cyclase domain-containing protein [Longimicrobiales bacterium]